MLISVVIPHFNQPAHLARGLAALTAQQDEAPCEILVVDNNSENLPAEVVAGFPGVRLLSETTPGPGPARNTGVAAASGDILAFIDADCIARPGWLAVIAERIGQGADILGGDVRIHHQAPGRPTVWEAYESEFAYRMEHYIRRQGFTGTGNLAMRRAVYDAVGPFAGIGVAEDRDWGQRATGGGYAITWAPEMRADHPARVDFSELARKWDRHIAHDFPKALAAPGGRVKWALKTAAMLVSPLAMIPRVALSRRIEGGVGGKIKAFAGLVRVRAYRARRMAGLIAARDSGRLSARWREN